MEGFDIYLQSVTAFFSQNWKSVIVVGVVVVGVMIGNIVRMRKMKAAGDTFLAAHPEAAKVWLCSKSAVTQSAVQALTVNGESPVQFQKGNRAGLYLLPGENTLALRYTYTRPGVMYKNVTKTWDGTVTMNCEAHKTYLIGFDHKTEQFGIEETA